MENFGFWLNKVNIIVSANRRIARALGITAPFFSGGQRRAGIVPLPGRDGSPLALLLI